MRLGGHKEENAPCIQAQPSSLSGWDPVADSNVRITADGDYWRDPRLGLPVLGEAPAAAGAPDSPCHTYVILESRNTCAPRLTHAQTEN